MEKRRNQPIFKKSKKEGKKSRKGYHRVKTETGGEDQKKEGGGGGEQIVEECRT